MTRLLTSTEELLLQSSITFSLHRRRKYMNKLALSGALLLASLGAASADPLGEWIVEDGVARIRIVDCSSRLWGVISWEKQPGGTDARNPDASKRSRPTLGMPILLNMKKAPAQSGAEADQWEGKVYNAENGKTYDAKIRNIDDDHLEIKGCVLGFLCGGQTWTRYADGAVPAAQKTAAKSKGKGPAGAADPSAQICAMPEIAGAPR
jgi:uncharacterized protein (DUF2147 family)